MSLSNSQTVAVQALLSGVSISKAAETAGVHRCTVHQWFRKPEFRAVVEQARLTQALIVEDQIRDMADSALSVIRQSLEDTSLPMPLRLRAALAVVKQATSLHNPTMPVVTEPEPESDPAGHVRQLDDISPIPNMAEIISNPIRPYKPPPPQPVISNKTPRNAQCPCGSGLKFKRCCSGKPVAA